MTTLLGDQATLFLIVGLILIAVDMLVVGLSPLMFIAAGALLTSALIHVASLDLDLLEALLLAAGLAVAAALLGWYPLRRLQRSMASPPVGSDLVGRELETTAKVDKSAGTIRWSGTEWRARLDATAPMPSVPPGTRVRITAVDGVTLVLAPAE